MKHLLIPDLICDTVYSVPFDEYYKKGIRALAFDIDNTLVSYDTPEPDEKLTAFLLSLRERGFSIAFVSNNDAARVERFNATLGFLAFLTFFVRFSSAYLSSKAYLKKTL